MVDRVSHRCHSFTSFVILSLFFLCRRFGRAFTVCLESKCTKYYIISDYECNRRRQPNPCSCLRSGVSSTTDNLPTDEDDHVNSLYPQLYGNTLVSVQTIASLVHHHYQQQQDAHPNTKSSPKVVFIDGSWYHRPDPVTNLHRNASQEFIAGPRLPLARYLDIDALATSHDLFPNDNPKKLPHMIPPPTLFSLAMDAYNICNEDHVVVYARRGALFTPRVWFLFHSMGHNHRKLHIMQGSLEDYIEVGGFVEIDECVQTAAGIDERYMNCFHQGILNVTLLYQQYFSTIAPNYKTFVTKAMNICTKDIVLEALSNGDVENRNTIIIDTRGSGYSKKGHMPMAIHLPYSQIASPANALVIQSVSMLKKLFDDRKVDYLNPKIKLILSCGSGVSVCHAYLALKELGRDITMENTLVYDGSWAEWGSEEDLPKILPTK